MKWFNSKESDISKREICRNCNNPYIEGDRYCRFCGAPMGKAEFILQTLREQLYLKWTVSVC